MLCKLPPITPSPELDAVQHAVDGFLAAATASAGQSRSRDDLGEDLRRTRTVINRLELAFARISTGSLPGRTPTSTRTRPPAFARNAG